MADINYKFLEKNGYLDNTDYKSLTEDWISLLNPIRIPNIRKYLKFTNLSYEAYIEEMKVSTRNASIINAEDEIDLTAAPLFFVTTFSSTLFPEFQDEYFAPLNFLTVKNYQNFKGLKMVDPSMYHSLTKAQYDLESLVKERYEGTKKFKDISEGVESCLQFLLPFEIDSEFPMTIILNVNLIVK